jgi:hypothetical protein
VKNSKYQNPNSKQILISKFKTINGTASFIGERFEPSRPLFCHSGDNGIPFCNGMEYQHIAGYSVVKVRF